MKNSSTSLTTKGFTLIEMLVTIAIIAIVSGVIIVGISPQKRIQDAQDSRARQDVRSVASAVEACLSYTDATSGQTNTVAACASSANLASTSISPCTPSATVVCGAPFARTIPSPVTVANSVSPAYVCVYEIGAPGATWYYSTATGKVDSVKPTGC